ncbi:hypothetical protein LTR85_007680 [Meristemomyces frigidus]|nr:hypothetical protein LTR85_007680 [Meristemomyces frigidus]
MTTPAEREKQHLQSLKYVVDATVSSARGIIGENLMDRDKNLSIRTPQWLAALEYAEQRIIPVEAEVGLLAKRLRDLAQNVLTDKDADDVTTVQANSRRPQASRGFEGMQKEKEKIINALRDAIAAFVDMKQERAKCEKALQEWLEEARADGRIR